MNRRLLCWRGAKREPDRAKHQETGWLVQPPIIFLIGTTPSAPFKGGFATFLLMAQPPLLIRGGEFCLTKNLAKKTRSDGFVTQRGEAATAKPQPKRTHRRGAENPKALF